MKIGSVMYDILSFFISFIAQNVSFVQLGIGAKYMGDLYWCPSNY